METDNVLSGMDVTSITGRYMTETFIINLLKVHLQKQNKELIVNVGLGSQKFHAYAPNGFDDFDERTYIEITSIPRFENLIVQTNKFIKNYNEEARARLLIVAMRPISDKYRKEFEKHFFDSGVQVTVWGPEDIQRIAQQHMIETKEIENKLFSLRLKSTFTKEQETWKEKRSNIIENVKSAYEGGQFSLFLGAGVSSSAGLPDWDTLLNSLFVSLLTSELDQHKNIENSEISSIVRRLREVDGPSALMSARYIRRGMSSNATAQTEFIDNVTHQLYSLRDQRKQIDSPLIKAIAAMCLPRRTGAKVRAVITYNFDDLLERELETRGIVHRSIFEEIEIPGLEELPVYHPHGYLPEDRIRYNNLNRSTLVFSEEGYHKIYNAPYHWSNLVQLNNFKESTCLMIGLSMTDPNLRRLLEIAALSIEKPKHYAFMKRIDAEHFTKDNSKKIVNAPIGTIKTFLDRHHSLNEEVLKELGVNIIWYESYDEIPKLLNALVK